MSQNAHGQGKGIHTNTTYKSIHELEKEVERAKLDGKEENERIRDFYEVIALGKSRTGKIVRSALGTSVTAENSLEKNIQCRQQP